MSKKKRARGPEIPIPQNTPELPNYVIPTTDLEYRECMDEAEPREDCADCRDEHAPRD